MGRSLEGCLRDAADEGQETKWLWGSPRQGGVGCWTEVALAAGGLAGSVLGRGHGRRPHQGTLGRPLSCVGSHLRLLVTEEDAPERGVLTQLGGRWVLRMRR